MAGIIASTPRTSCRWLARGAAAATAVALAGCVPYPIYKTLQPATQVTVVDAAGVPVAHADVTLIAGAYPYGREKSRLTQTTNAVGRVAFERVSEWRGEVLAIHGSEQYYWNLCVRRMGFKTYETRDRSGSDFAKVKTVTLAAGESTPCR